MDYDTLKYLEVEIKRYFPEPPHDASVEVWEKYEKDLRERAMRAYNELTGNPRDWVLVESYEEVQDVGAGLEVRLYWRKKS